MQGLDQLFASKAADAWNAIRRSRPGPVGNPEEAFLQAEEVRRAAGDELEHPHGWRARVGRALHR
jgi:hypothetical protein